MILELSSEDKLIKYQFNFYKNNVYKDKTISVINTSGLFSVSRNNSIKFKDSIDYKFKSLKFTQKGVKDPLVYDMVSWIFNLKLNIAGVISKEYMKTIWKKYRDKYRKKENIVAFELLESLYFKNLLGMEYSFLSNMPYLVFFINFYNKEIKEESIFKGIDFILMPMSIPLNTWYKCTKIDSQFLHLDGWVTLDN